MQKEAARLRMTTGELVELLSHHPRDAQLYAYDGEAAGLVIVGTDGTKLDFIFLPQESS